MNVHAFLAGIWYLLLGLILVLYVVTDGFDLGIGILTLLERDAGRRDAMMATIGGVWDANETWLVLFGGALFGAFPLVYAVTLHALYIPVSVMLTGLILRGVAFEFLAHARGGRAWMLAFGGGSLIAALAQGYMLGAVIAGLPVVNGVYAGGMWSWFGAFPSVVAGGVTAGYALLGGTYLNLKTSGELQRISRRRSRHAARVMLVAAACVTVMTPLLHDYVARRWFAVPAVCVLAVLPLAGLGAYVYLMRALARGSERAPFVWSVVIFVVSFVGLAASLYPYLLPPTLSLAGSASSSATLVFMLAGIGLLLPVMLVYNGFQYLVFRGKVPQERQFGSAAPVDTAQGGDQSVPAAPGMARLQADVRGR